MSDHSELKKVAEGCEGVRGVELIGARVKFHAAATPSVVLALIAENNRIKARLCACRDCGGRGEIYSGHSSYQGYNQPPEPDMDVCGTCGGDGVLGPVEDFEALAAERDRLKEEVEALKQNRFSLDNFDLDAEWTALRKDAERYQWLRDKSEALHSFYLSVPIWMTGVKFNKDTVDSTIDTMRAGAEQ